MVSRSRAERRAFRIVSSQFQPFDGAGAFRWGSRWLDPGCMVVHAAETYSLAVLENLVHWQAAALPPSLVCVVATIPKGINITAMAPNNINDAEACKAIGNAWYQSGETAVLSVPSVVSPFESNVLFNQMHSDFKKIEVAEPIEPPIDGRLFSAQ